MTLHEERHEEAGDENEATGASGLDPAASMSLLTSMLTNPLDAGYEHYRAEHGPTPNRFVGRLGVFVVAVALGFGSVVATVSLRTPSGTSRLTSSIRRRSAPLRSRPWTTRCSLSGVRSTDTLAPGRPHRPTMLLLWRLGRAP